jgi:hypothetical protein
LSSRSRPRSPGNDTYVSGTDPEARLARKGTGREAKLSYAGHLLMENRHGLAMDVLLTQATGTAERDAAKTMVEKLRKRHRTRRLTLGADKGYDTEDFVGSMRDLNVTPHVAQNITKHRGSRIDARTVCHSRLRHRPAPAQARRGDLRLAEGVRRRSQAALPGAETESTVGGTGHGSLQPGPNQQPDGGRVDDGLRRPMGNRRRRHSNAERPDRAHISRLRCLSVGHPDAFQWRPPAGSPNSQFLITLLGL